MTEIPDDVMKAAGKALHDPTADFNGNSLRYFIDERYVDMAASVIARAILAERERAAKVAKDAYLEFTNDAKLWLRDGMPKSSSNSTFMAVAAQTIFERIIKP